MIVLPVGISFARWVAELQVDYSTDEIPFPPSEDRWQDWAMRVKERNIFQNDDIPDPRGYVTWRDWAMRVTQVLI